MNPYFMRLHGMLAFPQKHRFQKILCPGATLFSLFQYQKGKLTYPLLPLYPPPLLLTLLPILQPISETIEQAEKLVFIRVSAEKGIEFQRKNSSGKRCSEWFQITLFCAAV